MAEFAKNLAALDRDERRARSRRKFGIREFDLARRASAAAGVGWEKAIEGPSLRPWRPYNLELYKIIGPFAMNGRHASKVVSFVCCPGAELEDFGGTKPSQKNPLNQYPAGSPLARCAITPSGGSP